MDFESNLITKSEVLSNGKFAKPYTESRLENDDEEHIIHIFMEIKILTGTFKVVL